MFEIACMGMLENVLEYSKMFLNILECSGRRQKVSWWLGGWWWYVAFTEFTQVQHPESQIEIELDRT